MRIEHGSLRAAPPTLDRRAALARIVEFAGQRLLSRRPVIINLAGESGSGKSTILHSLVSQLRTAYPDRSIRVIKLDDYYLGQAHVTDGNFDRPTTIDRLTLFQNLRDLRSGQTIKKPVYDEPHRQMIREAETVEPPDILLVDGLWSLDWGFRLVADLGVYVDAQANVRLPRRIDRDAARWGFPPAATVARDLSTVEPMGRLHVRPTIYEADLVIRDGLQPDENYAAHDSLLALHGNLSRLAEIETIAARMLTYRNDPAAARPTYISIFGSAGVGKSTTITELRKRDPSLVVIGFGNEMMATLTALGTEAVAHGFASADRDGLRSASTAAHDWLIDQTLQRIAGKYADPSQVYLIDGHNTITTVEGPTLGLSPFRTVAPPLNLSRSIILTDTPENIAQHMLADPSRKRDPDLAKITAQQELIRSIALANDHFAGAPYTDLTAPPLSDTPGYAQFTEELQTQVYRLAIRSHSPATLRTIFEVVTPANARVLFASGEIYSLLPEFRAFLPGVVAHKLLVIEAFGHFIAGDFRPLYDGLRHKDTDYETYAANFGRLKERYDALTPENQRLLWLAVFFHDVGKIVTRFSYHVDTGEELVTHYAKAFGLDASAAKLWCAVEGKHGYMGEVILTEKDPRAFLEKRAELQAAGIDPQLFSDLAIMTNVMDLSGFVGGRIIRNEYLAEFLAFLDVKYIETLRDNWGEESLKRFSKPGDEDFYGPFSEVNYQEMKKLLDVVIPAQERAAFTQFLHEGRNIFTSSCEMINLSLKNRLKYLRFLMHLSRNFGLARVQFLTTLPGNWKTFYPGRLDGWLDGIADDFTGQDLAHHCDRTSVFGVPYRVQGRRIFLDFSSLT